MISYVQEVFVLWTCVITEIKCVFGTVIVKSKWIVCVEYFCCNSVLFFYELSLLIQYEDFHWKFNIFMLWNTHDGRWSGSLIRASVKHCHQIAIRIEVVDPVSIVKRLENVFSELLTLFEILVACMRTFFYNMLSWLLFLFDCDAYVMNMWWTCSFLGYNKDGDIWRRN